MHKLSGVYGGRFSGAGFKGAIIALVDPAYKESIDNELSNEVSATQSFVAGMAIHTLRQGLDIRQWPGLYISSLTGGIAGQVAGKSLSFLSPGVAQKVGAGIGRFAEEFGEELTEFLGECEISGLYINFPDPWEGNEKNRIIQENLFSSLDKVLKIGGKLFFKTDHDKYYEDVLQLSGNLENYKLVYHTSDLHNSEKAEDNVLTEFEQLFLNKFQKNINYIEIEKIK